MGKYIFRGCRGNRACCFAIPKLSFIFFFLVFSLLTALPGAYAFNLSDMWQDTSDAYLIQSGSISGKVIADDTGLPISGVNVMACPQTPGLCMLGPTDTNGDYTISGVAAGNYRVQSAGSGSYVGEYYNNTYDHDAARLVAVSSGQETTGIDFGLSPGGSISGRGVADDSGLPISGIYILACPQTSGMCQDAVTDSTGDYS